MGTTKRTILLCDTVPFLLLTDLSWQYNPHPQPPQTKLKQKRRKSLQKPHLQGKLPLPPNEPRTNSRWIKSTKELHQSQLISKKPINKRVMKSRIKMIIKWRNKMKASNHNALLLFRFDLILIDLIWFDLIWFDFDWFDWCCVFVSSFLVQPNKSIQRNYSFLAKIEK